jgi:hypothetical protein
MLTNVGIFFLKQPKDIKGKNALSKVTCNYTEYISVGLYVEGKDQGAILAMRAWCEVGAKYGTQIPKITPFEFLTWCKDPIQFDF